MSGAGQAPGLCQTREGCRKALWGGGPFVCAELAPPRAASSCFEGWPPSPALGENAIRWRRSHGEGKRNRVLSQRGDGPGASHPCTVGSCWTCCVWIMPL